MVFGVPSVFAADTSEDATAQLVASWRLMSSVEKAELVEAMCLEADELARLGIAYREGKVTVERERFLMAVRRYGSEFANTYFGENSPVPLPNLCLSCRIPFRNHDEWATHPCPGLLTFESGAPRRR